MTVTEFKQLGLASSGNERYGRNPCAHHVDI